MKRLSMTVPVLAILAVLMLGGCRDGSAGGADGSSSKPGETTATNSTKPIMYTNEKLGFSLEFPASWEDLYTITENSGAANEGISIYHKATDDKHGESSRFGQFVYVGKFQGEYTQDEPPIAAGECRILTIQSGYTYACSYPSDVQYDDKNPDSEETKQYLEMKKQLDDVVASFKLL